jgi:drug/metabolite transporter (DMT)-like permease
LVDAARERLVGFACAAAVVAIWSGFITTSRLGVTTHLPPLDMVALRLAVAGAVMAPVLWRRRRVSRVGLGQGAALAATAGLGFSLCAFFGFSLAPAGMGAVLMPGTLPLWTALLAMLVLGERPGPVRLVGLGAIAAGIAVMLWSATRGIAPERLVAGGLFLAASILWAVYTVLIRRWRVDALDGAAAVCVGAAVAYLPAYALFADGGLAAVPWTVLVANGLFQGIASTVASLLLFTRAVQALGAARTAMVTAATPVAATLLAVPVAGDRLEIPILIGVALVTIGMLAAVFRERG